MRQTHVGGEKIFVDFAGDTIDVVDPDTGEVHAAKLFVAASRQRRAYNEWRTSGATGASSDTYAEAVASEGLEDWIGAHTHMLAELGGGPKAVVPDNLTSAVIKPDRYDPGLNRTYAETAEHYGTAILPARVRKSRDKAKVEVAVQMAQRWSLARLRNRRFFSLAELNAAIRPLLDDLSTRSCGITGPAAPISLPRWTARTCNRCPLNLMSSPAGSRPVLRRIITSRSITAGIRGRSA